MTKAMATHDATSSLTYKETREVITPYAFQVSPDLFGTPLASPARRGGSMLIDLALVGLLTQVSSLVLAGVAAFTFFRAGNRLKQKKRFNAIRIFLRFLTAILLFAVAFGVFDEFKDNSGNSNIYSKVGSDGIQLTDAEGLEVLALTAKYFIQTARIIEDIKEGKCHEAYGCWREIGEQLSKDIAALSLPKEKAYDVLNTFVDAAEDSLTTQQRLSLLRHLENDFAQRLQSHRPTLSGLQADISEAVSTGMVNNTLQAVDEIKPPVNLPAKEKSFIEWAEKIAEDLGWGLGWAAFYFTLFTAWWKGQTPGKRLMRIKVIKLDGEALSLWESLGRYGGYSAGLATGLSGFLQVYWDPNRQAIQDKISETLVIDLSKPKIVFEWDPEVDLPEVEN